MTQIGSNYGHFCRIESWLEMIAFVLLKIDTGQVRETCNFIRRIPSIEQVNIAFGPYDAIVRLQAPTLKQIGRVVEREIQPIPGVLQTLTCLAASTGPPTPQDNP